ARVDLAGLAQARAVVHMNGAVGVAPARAVAHAFAPDPEARALVAGRWGRRTAVGAGRAGVDLAGLAAGRAVQHDDLPGPIAPARGIARAFAAEAQPRALAAGRVGHGGVGPGRAAAVGAQRAVVLATRKTVERAVPQVGGSGLRIAPDRHRSPAETGEVDPERTARGSSAAISRCRVGPGATVARRRDRDAALAPAPRRAARAGLSVDDALLAHGSATTPPPDLAP